MKTQQAADGNRCTGIGIWSFISCQAQLLQPVEAPSLFYDRR